MTLIQWLVVFFGLPLAVSALVARRPAGKAQYFVGRKA
jgi:hypothetical protein